jgi:hypothetical protein
MVFLLYNGGASGNKPHRCLLLTRFATHVQLSKVEPQEQGETKKILDLPDAVFPPHPLANSMSPLQLLHDHLSPPERVPFV